MEQVNVDTTTAPEVIEQPGADLSTFEQLESFLDTPQQKVQRANETSDDLEKAANDKKLAKKADEIDQKAEAESKEEKIEKEVKKAKESADDKTDLKKALKSYKVKHGDKVLDLSPEGEVEVKINGKSEMAKIQDLISNYSGKVNWDRKYSELDTQRKSFQSDVEAINGRINEAFKLAVEQKNPRAAISYIAELMGANPREILKTFETQMKSHIEEMGKLSPEEARAKAAEEEANWYRQREQKRAEEMQHQQTRQEIGNRVESVQQKYGIDNQNFLRLYNELKLTGNYSDDTLTPELVGEYYHDIKTYDEVSKLLGESRVDDSIKKSATSELFSIWKQNPDFSKEDISEIASRVYGVKIAKNLSKKVRQADKEPESKVTKSSSRDPLTFEDLDE